MFAQVFLRYPEALRAAFPRLREKLDDPDPGVQSAAVNVICELARKNPKNYVNLAPTFFKLMTTSTNNWMLIKIIKLFGALTPLEPRLGKKLIEPLTNLIHSTSAMSLLYECINTVIAVLISISSGMPNHTAAIQLCVQKLRILIEDSDQNLKYLGLLAMSKILKTNPKSVQGHKDLILQCLDDSDESIRLRALDLISGMVSKKNLMEIVKKLTVHMEKSEGAQYRDEIMEKIIRICSQNDYQYITNFEWYISVLVELTRMEGSEKHGELIGGQMMDVAIRVEVIRAFAVSQMALLVENNFLIQGNEAVMRAAAWICGEFAEHLNKPVEILQALFRLRPAQEAYAHAAIKLFAFVTRDAIDAGETAKVVDLAKKLESKMSSDVYLQSSQLEVQERASSSVELLRFIIEVLEENPGSIRGDDIKILFAGELNPVGPKAQRKVPVPEGLDLDQWINEPPKEEEDESSEEESESDKEVFVKSNNSKKKKKKEKKKKKHKTTSPLDNNSNASNNEPTEAELKKSREARLLEQSMNPNYLKDPMTTATSSRTPTPASSSFAVEEIPVQQVDLQIPGLASADQYLNISRDSSVTGVKEKKRKKKKKKKDVDEDEDEEDVQVVVRKNVDLPEGVEVDEDDDDDDRGQLAVDDPHRALADVNLDDLDYREPYK